MAFKRNYEVSIWTLQDSFITVLKPANIEKKGMIENKKFELRQGEDINKYDFSIPMYIYENGQRIENPIWQNTINGTIIANMRKVKVILNKQTDLEAVYEFLIVDMAQRHERDQVYCDITCEDMAYHELSKTGYKVSLSSEVFENEYKSWFDNNSSAAEPLQTLQYWNDKFLTDVDTPTTLDSNIWYYDIQMDWSSYANGANRSSKKVYEEAYVNGWSVVNEQLIPRDVRTYQEKARPMNIEESNIFSVTQQLAETFGVFCRYQYLYDSNYYITGRRIVYYNNFIDEKEGYLDITYPYNASKVERKIEGKDITTKMFVQAVSTDAASDSGLITIMDAQANKSQEDYLLNFDYMLETGAIDIDQYNEVENFESKMRQLNIQIKELSSKLQILEEKIPPLRARLTTAQNAVIEDQNALNKANDELKALDIKDGEEDGYITISENNPTTGILIKNLDSEIGTYYVNITAPGVDPNSIKMYKTFTIGANPVLSNPISFRVEYDEFNNVTKLSSILVVNLNSNYTVYLTYRYRPKSKYDKIIQIWTARFAKDLANIERYTNELSSLENAYNTAKANYDDALAAKETTLSKFAQLMGPAIRESYWHPDDDYQSYGDKYIDNILFTFESNSEESGGSQYTQWKWDNTSFEDEQKVTYEYGIEQTVKTYPCIKLSNTFFTKFANRLNDVSFMYYDYSLSQGESYNLQTIRKYPVNSQSQYGFVNISGVITPVLILTFADLCSNDELNMMQDITHYPQLGILTIEENGTTMTIAIDSDDVVPVTVNDWVTPTSAVYPRIEISTLNIYTDSSSLSVKLNNTLLNQYEDYYLTTRENGKYYLTIKPIKLLELMQGNNNIELFFTVSNASTTIYLDALQLLQENAYPKVSYTIDPNVFPITFIQDLYNKMHRVVNINDIDLKLENVQGYISSVSLDLDMPQNDKLEVKNYKNKFDDLFTNILAQTQAIQKSNYTLNLMSQNLTSTGELTPNMLQNSMRHAMLNYAFNQGKLTIDEENGIWGVSEAGVVAFRGGGIFTATQKDAVGNWIWNTGVIPQGINADLITSGQLDTNRVMVYAGDKLRFQLNGDGLFAYKSFFEDLDKMSSSSIDQSTISNINARLAQGKDIDSAQFVKMDMNGLTLIAKPEAMVMAKTLSGNYIYHVLPRAGIATQKVDELGYTYHVVDTNGNQIYNADGTLCYNSSGEGPYYYYDSEGNFSEVPAETTMVSVSYGTYTIPSEGIKRVSISWDGLSLKNYQNEQVFFADANTGNLYLKGRIYEMGTYIDQVGVGLVPLKNYVGNIAEKRLGISAKLQDLFNKAGEILVAAGTSLKDLMAINMENFEILNSFKENVRTKLVPKVTRGPKHPTKFKPGDVWEKAPATDSLDSAIEGVYIAVAYWDEIYANETQAGTDAARASEAGWVRTHDYSLAAITGANMKVDAEAGTIDILAQKAVTINSAGQINLGANKDVNIIGNENINLGGAKINITSSTTSRNNLGGIHFAATKYDSNSAINGQSSTVDINADGIKMASLEGIEITSGAGITIKSADVNDVAVLELNKDKGVWLGSGKSIRIFSGATDANGQVASGANVALDKDRLMLGVVNVTNSQGTAVDITDEYFIVASGNTITGLQSADITFADNTGLAGLKLTKEGFGFAAGSGNGRSVVIIDDEGIQLGTTTNPKSNGSYVEIKTTGIELGSQANLTVGTNNIIIDTTATGSNTIFGIGTSLLSNNPNYYLKYDSTNGLAVNAGSAGGWEITTNELHSYSTSNGSIDSSTFVALNSNPSGTYAIWAGSVLGSSAPFSVQRDGTVTMTKLNVEAGSGSNYIGISSSGNYAIWAGAQSGANAPFSVQPDGTVVLTNIKVKNEQGSYTTLTNYPFWKLSSTNVKNASLSADQKTLTITRFVGEDITFNKAASLASDFDWSWSGTSFRGKEKDISGAAWQTIETIHGTWSSHTFSVTGSNSQNTIISETINVDHSPEELNGFNRHKHQITISSLGNLTATLLYQFFIDGTSEYNNGWTNAYNQIVIPSSGSSTYNNIYLPNATPDGEPVNNALTLRLNDTDPSQATVSMHWRNSTKIGEISIDSIYNAGLDAVDFRSKTWNGDVCTITLDNKSDGTPRTTTVTAPSASAHDFYVTADGSWSNGTFRVRSYDAITGEAFSGQNKYYDVAAPQLSTTSGNFSAYYNPSGKNYSLQFNVGNANQTVSFSQSDTTSGTGAYEHGYSTACNNVYIDTSGSSWISGYFDFNVTDGQGGSILESGSIEMPDAYDSFSGSFKSGTNMTYDLSCTVGGKEYTTTMAATTAYNNGKAAAITVSAAGWSGGSNTITGTNGTASGTLILAAPTIEYDSCFLRPDHKYSVTVEVGGANQTFTLDDTQAWTDGYTAGAGSSSVTVVLDSGSWSGGSRTITATNGVGGSTLASTTISAPTVSYNSEQYISGNKSFSVTVTLGGGNQTIIVPASDAYDAGWIDGYNAAVAASGQNSNVITVPTITSTQGTTPTTTYTITAALTDKTLRKTAADWVAAGATAHAYIDGTSVDHASTTWALQI